MKQNIKLLYEDFKEIKKLGYVKGIKNGSGNIGQTFESLLGKDADNFSFPDYNGIEIKVKHTFSKGYITLFNATPDGRELFEISRLQRIYGYPDKDLKCNIFKGSIVANEKRYIGMNYKFQLKVDYVKEVVVLNIYDKFDNLIDDQTSWSFKYLKEKLEMKLQYLAFIKAQEKIIREEPYFYYYYIAFYKLRDFNAFIKLIESGKIRITFKVGVVKSGEKKGCIWDHGTGFDIHIYDLKNLYERIFYQLC